MGMGLMIVFAGLFIVLASACGLASVESTDVRGDSFAVRGNPSVVESQQAKRLAIQPAFCIPQIRILADYV